VQRKKKEIEEDILQKAELVFFEKDFYQTNLKDIASLCNITTSAIYIYFQSKEDLFDAVVKSTYEGLLELSYVDIALVSRRVVNAKHSSGLAYRLIRKFLIKNAKKIYILWYHSKGSKYEGIFDKTINDISIGISEEIGIVDLELTKFYANLIIHGITMVLQNYSDNPKMIDYYCQNVLPVSIQSIKNLKGK
jgi:AcrR family transcriptional regulator